MTGVAVKVTEVPVQIPGPGLADMETAGVSIGEMDIVSVLLVTDNGKAQFELLCNTQVTRSLLLNPDMEIEGLLILCETPLTNQS